MNHTRLAELSKVAAIRVQAPEPDYNLNELIMEMYGNTLCVSFTELVRGGIISKSTYDKYVREGKLTLLQRGGNGREALIAYRSMPERLRAAYDDTFKNAYEEMKQREQEKYINTQIRFDAEAVTFYQDYRPQIDRARQLEYILNAQVMNEMVRTEKARSVEHAKGGFARRAETWSSVQICCERLREITGHTLPKNPARLREKFNQYKRESYVALVNKNTGNMAARRIGKAEGALLLKLRRSKFPVYTDMQLFEEYNRQAVLRGLKTIKSPTTMHSYLNDPAVMVWWFSAVHGEREFKNKYMPTFDTVMPSMPNSLWYSDGTKINLYYRAYDDRQKRWVARTTDVYEVMDACTELFLGYFIGDGENFYHQYMAYRMALQTWKVKPYEIVTDNQGGHKKLASQGFFKKLCHLHKTTMPHNGQSKSIESAFGRFQQQVLHKLYNFTGQNITARKLSSRANIDLVMANIDLLPTLEELKQQYADCRKEWNSMQHSTSPTGMTRREMYTAIENPQAQPLDDYEAHEIFMLFSQAPVQYTKEGFNFRMNKQEYSYMVYGDDGLVDMNFHLQNVGRQFLYRYDPEDMTRIELWAVTDTGAKYATIATPKVTIHRATQERTEEENAYLFAQLDANRRTRAAMHIAQEELFMEEAMGEAYTLLRIPRPVAVSEKQLDGYREEMKRGTLEAPVPMPETDIPEEPVLADEPLTFASSGDWTKKVSNLTFDELDSLGKF